MNTQLYAKKTSVLSTQLLYASVRGFGVKGALSKENFIQGLLSSKFTQSERKQSKTKKLLITSSMRSGKNR